MSNNHHSANSSAITEQTNTYIDCNLIEENMQQKPGTSKKDKVNIKS